MRLPILARLLSQRARRVFGLALDFVASLHAAKRHHFVKLCGCSCRSGLGAYSASPLILSLRSTPLNGIVL